MDREERALLLGELSIEKEAHTTTLHKLKEEQEKVQIANFTIDNLNQQLSVFAQINETLQQNFDETNKAFAMIEQQLMEERTKNLSGNRLEQDLEDLRLQLVESQNGFDQELRKISEERRRFEEEYKVLESQKLAVDRELLDTKRFLEDERIQAEVLSLTVSNLQKELDQRRESSTSAPVIPNIPNEEHQELIRKLQDESAQLSRALVVATDEQQRQQQQIEQLQQQLREQQHKHQQELQQQQQQQVVPQNNNQEELAALQAQLVASERERSQATDKLADATEQLKRTTRELQHKIDYQNEEIRRLELQYDEAKATEKKAHAELNRIREETSLLNKRQVAAEAEAGSKLAVQLEQLEADLRKSLHSEEALKRDVDVEKRKYAQLLEEYEKIKEAVDVLQEQSDKTELTLKKAQREKNDLQNQIKSVQQEVEAAHNQTRRVSIEKEEIQHRLKQAEAKAAEEQRRLEVEAAELSRQIKSLQESKEELLKNLREKKEDNGQTELVHQLREYVRQLEGQKEELSETLRHEQQRIKGLSDEVNITRRQLEEYQNQHSMAATQHQQQERALEDTVAQLEASIEALKKEAQQETHALQQALDQAHKAVEAEKERTNRLAEVNNQEKGLIQELRQSVATLEKQLKERKGGKEEELKKKLREEMLSHSSTLQQLEESQKNLQQGNEIITKLTSDIKKLQETTAPLKRELDAQKAKIAQLSKTLADEREAWKQEQQRQEQLKKNKEEQIYNAAIENLKKQHEEETKELNEELSKKTKAYNFEREAHERASHQVAELTQNLEREKSVIVELKAKVSDLANVNEQLKHNAGESVQSLQQAHQKTLSELQEEQKQHATTKALLKQHLNQITALQTELNIAKEENVDITTNLHKLEQALEESLNLHKEESKSYSSQSEQIKNQLTQSREQISKLLLEIEDRKITAQRQHEKIESLELLNSQLQEDITQLRADVATLSEAHHRIDYESRAQIEKIEKEKKADEDLIKQLQTTISQLKQNEESTSRHLEIELSELKRELTRERDAHSSTKEQLEKERIDMELTMIENLQTQINRLREVYESQAVMERDFLAAQQLHLEDGHPNPYFGRKNELHFPASQKIKEGVGSLQRELASDRETLKRLQHELDEERRNSRTAKELANELELHVMELTRAHAQTATDLENTQRQIGDLKKELEREKGRKPTTQYQLPAHYPYHSHQYAIPPSSYVQSYPHVYGASAPQRSGSGHHDPQIYPPLSPTRSVSTRSNGIGRQETSPPPYYQANGNPSEFKQRVPPLNLSGSNLPQSQPQTQAQQAQSVSGAQHISH